MHSEGSWSSIQEATRQKGPPDVDEALHDNLPCQRPCDGGVLASCEKRNSKQDLCCFLPDSWRQQIICVGQSCNLAMLGGGVEEGSSCQYENGCIDEECYAQAEGGVRCSILDRHSFALDMQQT